MKLFPVFLALGVACGGLQGCFAAATPEVAEDVEREEKQVETVRTARQLSEFQDARINESSGIAASRKFPALFWTHNDSGDEARAWLVDPKSGATKTLVSLRDAQNLDWEDCAVGAGKDGATYLYLGDIGDNLRRRPNIIVYRVAESGVKADAAEQAVASEKQTLLYPDGAHDAETLIAAPDERLIVVTKSADGSGIYISPAKFEAGTTQTLKKLGEVKFGGISFFSRLSTGGDLSADGKRIVIRTYTHAYEWTLPDTDLEKGWWKTPPRKFVLPTRPQGEAIAYAADGTTLVASTEKLPAALDEIAPEDVTDVGASAKK
ncbi:MAG TPA: hypothetical protein VF681_06720 [Abditibacteriaceae bacterium]|jgi:hypothetical protein